MTVRTVGWSRMSGLWPGVATKMRPAPQDRVQIAGAVTVMTDHVQGTEHVLAGLLP